MDSYEHDFPVPGVRFDYSATPKSNNLNGLHISTGLKGMLEGKDYSNIDMVFPFIAAFLDRVLGYADNQQLTMIHSLYSDVVNMVMYNTPDWELQHENVNHLEQKVRMLKRSAKELFEHLEEVNLFTLKFHMLDHVSNDLYKFGILSFLDASAYEHFNFTIKKFIRMTSMRKLTTIEEAVHLMNETPLNTEKDPCILKIGAINALSRDGIKVSLATVNKTSCSLTEHLTRDGRGVLAN